MSNAYVDFYASMVIAGRRDLEQIPEVLRDEVANRVTQMLEEKEKSEINE